MVFRELPKQQDADTGWLDTHAALLDQLRRAEEPEQPGQLAIQQIRDGGGGAGPLLTYSLEGRLFGVCIKLMVCIVMRRRSRPLPPKWIFLCIFFLLLWSRASIFIHEPFLPLLPPTCHYFTSSIFTCIFFFLLFPCAFPLFLFSFSFSYCFLKSSVAEPCHFA